MNIKNVRIGNDILISWKIWIDQEGQIPFDFTDKTVKLMMKRGFKEWEMPIQIEGNTLFTTYYGKDQDQVGRHTLYLVINEGLPNMSTLDACIVINLINTTCQRNKKESCSEINAETISLSGDLSVDKIINLVEVDDQMSNTSENPVQNKVVKQYIDNKIPALNLGSAAYANVEDFEKKGSIENASTKLKEFINSKDFVTASELKKKLDELDIKVDLSDYLVSGVTIKTINKQSLLGSGNIQINPGLSVYVLKSLFYYDIVEAYNMQQSITIPENDLAYMRENVGNCVFLLQSTQHPDGPEYYHLNIRQDDADTYLDIYDSSGVYQCDFPRDTLLPKVLLRRIDYGLPNGGLEGEVLTKRSNKLGDVEWRAPIIEDGSITLAKLSQEVQEQLESEIPYLYCSNNKWSGDYAAVSDALRQSLPYIILIKVNNEKIQAVSAWRDSGKVPGYTKYYIEFKIYVTEGSGIVEKTYRALDDSTKTVTEIDSQLISSAGGEEGGSIEVDSEMSDTSENPVQNKVVKSYVDEQSKYVAETFAYIADNVMPSQKEAQSGNVAVFDEEGNVTDSGHSVCPLTVEEISDIPSSTFYGTRLLLEWDNSDAEVLQPVSYDSTTGYFTVESMPSWLAEDGVIVPATINYSNTLLVNNMYGTNDVNNVPFSKDNTAPIQYIHRVSSSQFQVLSKNDVNSASNVTIDANTKCDYFYYTNTPNIGFKLAAKGEYGRKRFRIIFSNACVQLEKFIDGVTCDENLVYQTAYTLQWSRIWNAPRPFANSGEYLIEVDLDNGRYRYLSYELAGIIRTSATAKSYLYQKSMNIQPWSNIWGWGRDNVYFKFDGKYIAKDTTIKLYEIIE